MEVTEQCRILHDEPVPHKTFRVSMLFVLHLQKNFIPRAHLLSFNNQTDALIIQIYSVIKLFSGLGVACWPLVPKFAGSNPAEAVGFLRAKKNPQHAFLRRGSKVVGPMS